ncbi:MAG: hypothetical protein A3F09_01720 [Chlamydiae bacterium RIFCSPHIGHO2_12_FULL_49_11]|nr:MAG: hypothetical protein A3F09_01720 [Chlamydiae bacterium RIFCSPHIGHO2_12_FULL_49_11]
MKPKKVISYFSKKLISESVRDQFEASCKKNGIDYFIEEVAFDSLNTFLAYKPHFIIKELEKSGEDVLYVDIDSVFQKAPTFFDKCRADISLYLRDELPFDDDYKLVANTIFAKPTYSGKKLLNLWNLEAKRRLKKLKEETPLLDQLSLKKVILHYPTIVELRRIPRPFLSFPYEKRTGAVIEHTNSMREHVLQTA